MLIGHLFVSYAHVNLCHFFSSSWCRGLAAASAYGSSWTFLFTFFQKQRKQEAHFGNCQRPLQADSTAHYKTVMEWNTHPYSFDMAKRIQNFTKKQKLVISKPYHQVLNKLFPALTITQSVET